MLYAYRRDLDYTKDRDDCIGVWYRYEDHTYASSDEFDSISDSSLEVRLVMFPVVKVTPKGVWLGSVLSNKRFVLRDATRRYACPTRAEARESYIARKRKQARIYQHRVDRATECIRAVSTPEELEKAATG